MNEEKKYSSKQILRFLIPSLIGVFLFLFPVPINGEWNLTIAVLASTATNMTLPIMPYVVYGLIYLSAIGTIVARVFKPNFIMQTEWIKTLFYVGNIWFTVRILGAVITFLCMLQVGPEMIISADTGSFLIHGLLVYWVMTILVAGSLMDLLLNYGLLEFVGSYMSKIMRPLYRVPGRSAIDCLASWLGDAIIGILITTKQYQDGYYSKREAAVIATTFSAVSISFSLLVVSQLQLTHMFLPFFVVNILTGFTCGAIMTRIPPLSRISDTYHVETQNKEEKHTGKIFSLALSRAVTRSDAESTSIVNFVKKGVKTSFEASISCMPTVMLIGTVSLIISYYTDFFSWLGVPFVPFLNLLGIPEAEAAAATVLSGFGDMFIPSVLASSTITSEYTKFFVGVLSITQLIYMSEVGALLLSSKLPLKFTQLLLIFILRTIICIPLIVLFMTILGV